MNEDIQKQALSWAGLAGSLMGAIEVALIDIKYNDTDRAVETLREILQRSRKAVSEYTGQPA